MLTAEQRIMQQKRRRADRMKAVGCAFLTLITVAISIAAPYGLIVLIVSAVRTGWYS